MIFYDFYIHDSGMHSLLLLNSHRQFLTLMKSFNTMTHLLLSFERWRDPNLRDRLPRPVRLIELKDEILLLEPGTIWASRPKTRKISAYIPSRPSSCLRMALTSCTALPPSTKLSTVSTRLPFVLEPASPDISSPESLKWSSEFTKIKRADKVTFYFFFHIDGLVQERRNSIALAMELCHSCINPSIWSDYLYFFQ